MFSILHYVPGWIINKYFLTSEEKAYYELRRTYFHLCVLDGVNELRYSN